MDNLFSSVKEEEVNGYYKLQESTLSKCYYTKICSSSNVISTPKGIKTYKMSSYRENCIIVHITDDITLFTVIDDKMSYYTKLSLPITIKELVNKIYKIREYVLSKHKVNIDVCCSTSLLYTNKLHAYLQKMNNSILKNDLDCQSSLSNMQVLFVRYNFNRIIGNWLNKKFTPLPSLYSRLKMTELNKGNYSESFGYLVDKTTISILVLKNDILYVSARICKSRAQYKMMVMVNGSAFRTYSFKGTLPKIIEESFSALEDLITKELLPNINPIHQTTLQSALNRSNKLKPEEILIEGQTPKKLNSLAKLSESSDKMLGDIFFTTMKLLPLD